MSSKARKSSIKYVEPIDEGDSINSDLDILEAVSSPTILDQCS